MSTRVFYRKLPDGPARVVTVRSYPQDLVLADGPGDYEISALGETLAVRQDLAAAVAAPLLETRPAVTGDPAIDGGTLTRVPGVWSGADNVTVAWFLGSVATGETGETLTVDRAAMGGQPVRLRERASNASGHPIDAFSDPIGVAPGAVQILSLGLAQISGRNGILSLTLDGAADVHVAAFPAGTAPPADASAVSAAAGAAGVWVLDGIAGQQDHPVTLPADLVGVLDIYGVATGYGRPASAIAAALGVQIDTLPATLVASSPKSGASNIALDESIEIVLSEPLQPTGTIVLSADGLTVATYGLAQGGGDPEGTVALDGASILIVPGPFAEATAYQLDATGLKDLAGNDGPGFQIAFTTEFPAALRSLELTSSVPSTETVDLRALHPESLGTETYTAQSALPAWAGLDAAGTLTLDVSGTPSDTTLRFDASDGLRDIEIELAWVAASLELIEGEASMEIGSDSRAEFTWTVSGAGHLDGAYSVDQGLLADDGLIPLAPPGWDTSAGAGIGDAVTPLPGLFLHDIARGDPVFDHDIYDGNTLVRTAAAWPADPYVIPSGSDQTVIHRAVLDGVTRTGSRILVPDAAYAPYWHPVSNAGYWTSQGQPADADEAIVFALVRSSQPALRQRFLSQVGSETRFYLDSNGSVHGRFRRGVSGAATNESLDGGSWAANDAIGILASYRRDTADTNRVKKMWLWKQGVWSAAVTGVAVASAEKLLLSNRAVGLTSEPVGSDPLFGEVARLFLATANITGGASGIPDIGDAATRDAFVGQDGQPADPSLAQALVQTLLVDVHAPAHWETGGSLGSLKFTKVTP